MRNYIVYFLTSLFLLFVVESKLNVKTLRSDFSGHISHNYPEKSNHSSHKFSFQQLTDTADNFTLELAEDDFHLADTVQAIIVFASVFGLMYSFGLLFKKRVKPAFTDFLQHFRSVKTFILIRSIRI
nr:hypothetical protein [uncultured Chryseobacterium sp.]